MKRLHLVTLSAALAVLGSGLVAAPAQAAGPDAPILSKWANPGVVKTASGYAMLHTTAWNAPGAAATAPRPNGPWKRTKTKLLTKTPAWAKAPKGKKQSRSVWAPSMIQGTNGTWVAFYSAPAHGTGKARCIGTGTSASPTGPFVPDARPIACFKGSRTNPQDEVRNEKSTSLIDPTPAAVGGQTVLTYKTSHAYKAGGRLKWHTTIRMLALNPATPNVIAANPVHASGASIQLTNSRHKYIEENPSLVLRGGTYTLFTSWGWYGTKDQYWTRYRQNSQLWSGWGAKKPSRLTFPKTSHTWGWGNGQAVAAPKSGWLFFWNGQERSFHRGDGPKNLYVGKLGWKGGKPRVATVLKRR